MRRISWLILVVLVVVALGYWYQAQRPPVSDAPAGAGLRLTNRPATFCPTTARVVILRTPAAPSLQFDQEVAVTNCEHILLDQSLLADPVEFQLFAYVTGTKALRAVAAGPITSLIDAPIQVGDTNNDNVINEVDQRFVELRIGQTGAAALDADVDGDSQVTILDYSLVATNQGAGQLRPDNKQWVTEQ